MSLSSPPASAPRPSSSSSSLSSSILHLYAELLLHIRTVTFFASLRTDHTEQTRAELSADGESITLTHEGERASIRLPTRVVGGGSAALTLPASPAKELSLRLQLKERSPGGLLKGGAGGGENVVPWDAGRLAECGRVECRGCGREVVKVGKSGDDGAEEVEVKVKADEAAPSEERGRGVKKWMDLPNENWAEMMDFWHCHKPHEHHLSGHTHTRDGVGKEKGYAASNRIMAKKGVGYVDLAYLLLTEEDCLGVQPSKSTSPSDSAAERQQLTCSSCKTIVGVTDPRAEGWRIWKWSIAATPKDSTTNTKTYSLRKWVAAQLLYLIENQAVRKFTVMAESGVLPGEEVEGGSEAVAARDPIMIWVFTPDLSFSSSIASSDDDSNSHRNDPTRAMKVLWKPAPAQNGESTQSAAGQALDRQSLSTEDLSLPLPAFDALKEGLEESGRWLPASARTFQEWNVGLLERFGEDEVQ
ncbi:hypothetical protein BFW01_g4600 [Lasiodiplodia theobromae]|nr:hypothetical protein BFW01_g4600 [Lasiodiplodia theobromae]